MKTITYMESCKVRLMPNDLQLKKFYQHSGATNFIWNNYLEWQMSNYDYSNLFMSKKTIIQSAKSFFKILKELRKTKEYAWLNDISLHSLTLIKRELEKSYDRFFKIQGNKIIYTKKVLTKYAKQNKQPSRYERKGHPKFKKKKDKKYSFTFDGDGVYLNEIHGQLYVQLPKIGKVLIKTNLRCFPIGRLKDVKGLVKNPTVKYVNGKWILSFSYMCEKQVQDKKIEENTIIGIDRGIKILAAVSNCGENHDKCFIFANINKKSKTIKMIEKQLLKLQKNMARKKETCIKIYGTYKRSKRMQKEIDKYHKLNLKLHNIRVDYLHKVTHRIMEQDPCALVVEDYSNSFIVNNKNGMSKAARKQLLSVFENQLTYKAFRNNVIIIRAEQKYPSSQLCCKCGSKKKLSLKNRVYECDKCGLKIDRDVNAAINLHKYGVQKLISIQNPNTN